MYHVHVYEYMFYVYRTRLFHASKFHHGFPTSAPHACMPPPGRVATHLMLPTMQPMLLPMALQRCGVCPRNVCVLSERHCALAAPMEPTHARLACVWCTRCAPHVLVSQLLPQAHRTLVSRAIHPQH